MSKAIKTIPNAVCVTNETHSFCSLLDVRISDWRDERLAREIKNAIDTSDFFLLAQGIFDCYWKKAKSELLARIRGEDGRVIPPSVFVPIVDAIGYRNIFDYRVLEKAYATVSAKKLEGIFSINISPSTFEQDDYFIAEVDRCAFLYGVSPKQIIFEILETEVIEDYERFNRILASLRARGYKIAVDDFNPIGNHNLLSLAKLGRQEVDIVKFDGGFVEELYESRNSVDWPNIRKEFGYLKDAIFADRPGIEIIIEKVESEEVFRFFETLDSKGHILCYQGYYFDRGTPLV